MKLYDQSTQTHSDSLRRPVPNGVDFNLKMSGKFGNVDESLLRENDIRDVRFAISSIAAKWDELGGNLGLQQDTIETIAANFSLAQRRFTEVLINWLRWNYDHEKIGKPSWKNLVKAVHPINDTLANSIAEEHTYKARGTGSTDKNRKRSRPVSQQQAPRLTDKDMATLTNELWTVRSKFYNLGMNLGIDRGTLDVATKLKDDDAAFNLIIKTWLQKSTPQPTWRAMIQALRSNNLKEDALANDTASKYCPDEMIPVEKGDDEPDLGTSCSPPVEKRPRRLSPDDSSPVEQKAGADPRWCTAVTKLKALSGASPSSGAPAGVAVIEALWNKKKLGVKFIGNRSLLSNWKLNGDNMTTDTIIALANTWSDTCASPYVPYFVDVEKETGLKDDIRVDFNDKGVNKSWIGMEANQYPNEATMHLSLTKAWSDDLKRHYIIHEFGHALGLGHEHQRSKFWEFLLPFVNITLMKHDSVVGGDKNFKDNWGKTAESYFSSDLGANSGEYDPQSIMHYWFKVEWLNRTPFGEKDYSVWSNVQTDHETMELSEDAYKVLQGIHQYRHRSLATKPSSEDISFLKKCYEPGVSNQSGQVQQLHQNQASLSSGPSPDLDSHHQKPTELPKDVTSWSVQQVFDYFSSLPDCKEDAQFFKDQKISGESLLDLTEGDLREYKVRLGPLKVMMRHINKLQQQQMSED